MCEWNGLLRKTKRSGTHEMPVRLHQTFLPKSFVLHASNNMGINSTVVILLVPFSAMCLCCSCQKCFERNYNFWKLMSSSGKEILLLCLWDKAFMRYNRYRVSGDWWKHSYLWIHHSFLYACMLISHLMYLSYYFSASVIPFKKIIMIIILLCCWQYDMVDTTLLKSPLFIIFPVSSEIVLSGEFKVSLSFTALCFLWEIELWNSACVDVWHFSCTRLGSSNLFMQWSKKHR